MRQKVYVQTAIVAKVEERFNTVWAGGTGKDATTKEVSDGWWITFRDNLSAVRCASKPDCAPGDIATCTWEFKKP